MTARVRRGFGEQEQGVDVGTTSRSPAVLVGGQHWRWQAVQQQQRERRDTGSSMARRAENREGEHAERVRICGGRDERARPAFIAEEEGLALMAEKQPSLNHHQWLRHYDRKKCHRKLPYDLWPARH